MRTGGTVPPDREKDGAAAPWGDRSKGAEPVACPGPHGSLSSRFVDADAHHVEPYFVPARFDRLPGAGVGYPLRSAAPA